MSHEQQESTALVKASALQGVLQPTMARGNPDVESVLQNLQLVDPAIIRILKGEVHEHIEQLKRLLAVCREKHFEDYIKQLDMTRADPEQLKVLLQFINLLKQLAVSVAGMERELPRYQKMVPFILALSPLMSLSNLSREEVDQIKSTESCMVFRLRLESEDQSDLALSSRNFYDIIECLMHAIVSGSTEGWKQRILTEERKVANINLVESKPQQKKRFGLI